MTSHVLYLSFQTILLLSFDVNICYKVPLASRNVNFHEFTPHYKALGYEIRQFSAKNHLECSISCLADPDCKSYSFCNGLCFLNEIGFEALRRNGRDHIFSSTDKNCNLLSMNKHFVPQCKQAGINRSVRDDSNTTICKINKKRVDGVFLERVYFNISVNTSEEFRGFSTRKCLPETALNGGFC